MRASDMAGILAIEAVSFGRHHWSEDSFLNEMNNPLGRYYTLVDHGCSNPEGHSIIGYAGYWIVLDEGHITTVAVSPHYRGMALGELMLAHMLERCAQHSVKWFTLEVRVSNHSAQNLYYKYGFQSLGTRPRYYQDTHEDALIMTTPNLSEATQRARVREQREQLKNRLGGWPQGFGAS